MKSRSAGLALMLCCALMYSPEGTNPPVLGAIVLPIAAAIGLWLVLPNPVLLSGCVFALALAHSISGAQDLYSSRVYPFIALIAGAVLLRLLFLRKTDHPTDGGPQTSRKPPSDS